MQKEFPVRQRMGLVSNWRVSLVLSVSLLFAIADSAIPGFAQELGTGVISGEGSDPQGAMVRGAQVTVIQKATGLDRRTLTKAAGLFAINDLALGAYQLQVSAGSFSHIVSPVQLQVGQQTNIKVQLGVEQQKTVININDLEAAPLVNTASSVVDGVINSQQIDNLPLNGRNFLELSLLTRGNWAVAATSASTAWTITTMLSAACC